MKTKLLFLINLLCSFIALYAQVPQAIPYQAVARNNAGTLIVNQNISIRFSIHDLSAGGAIIYQETQNRTTNTLGLFTTNIGLGVVVIGTFGNINWGNGAKYMQVEIDAIGGNTFVDMGTQQMFSVPYAIYSDKSKNGLPDGTMIGQTIHWNGISWLADNSIYNDGTKVGIGTSNPENSAQLEINSTAKGFLPPRMTYEQKISITNPVAGLVLWCTNCGTLGELQVYNGVSWTNMVGGAASPVLIPVLVTTVPVSITMESAIGGGNVTSDYGFTITNRGVCWSSSPNPTIALATKTSNGTGTGIFTSNIVGLISGTTYYVKAYATNIKGTGYGNEIIFTTLLLPVGAFYQGGRIAYILQSGDPGYNINVFHGLIATTSDQSVGAPWGCQGTIISGADGTTLGTGNQNTIDIMNGCPNAGISARICGDLVFNGYSDWYLPSVEEIDKLYLNRVAIGGFTNTLYWTSTEYGNSDIYSDAIEFAGGTHLGKTKFNSFRVRAIRTF